MGSQEEKALLGPTIPCLVKSYNLGAIWGHGLVMNSSLIEPDLNLKVRGTAWDQSLQIEFQCTQWHSAKYPTIVHLPIPMLCAQNTNLARQ